MFTTQKLRASHVLSLSIAAALATPFLATSALATDMIDTQIETFAAREHGILAEAGNTVTATRVDVTAHGYQASALLANGAGSTVSHTGGTLRSEGSLGNTASPQRKGS